MSKPVLMFHAGAGGVGKTAAITKALEFAPAFGRTVVIMPSITRSVYADLGITGEKAATDMDVPTQFKLQHGIQERYYQTSRDFLIANADKDMVMIDRSPLDHISYLLHNLAFHMSLQQTLGYLTHAWDWLHEMRRHCSSLAILYYPYPEPWHIAAGERQSSDGFRFDAGGKNYMWDCILQTLLNKTWDEMAERLLADSVDIPTGSTPYGRCEVIHFPDVGMTIEQRARYILDKVRILKGS